MSPVLPPDERLRALQLQAEGALSPATLQRLRAARQAGATRASQRPAWWLPAAFAAVAVLAVGAGLQRDATPPAIAPMVAALEAENTGFDENPDLYVWLASTDLAME